MEEQSSQKNPQQDSLDKTRDKSRQVSYAIPIAIVIAGLLISGTVYFSQGGISGTQLAANIGDGAGAGPAALKNLLPVTENDHILGDFNAPIKLIEFSDLECPFCKRFHATVTQIMEEYGSSGQVAWVYRHFPLTSLHPKAVSSAIASECANELGGNIGFWKFVNRYFEVTPSNNQINLSLLPSIAEDAGLNKVEFEACLENNDYESLVQAQYQDAVNSGGTGTPFSVVINSKGEIFPILGAQPIESVRATIEQALKGN